MNERLRGVRDRLKKATQAKIAEKTEVSGGMSAEAAEMLSMSDMATIDISAVQELHLQQQQIYNAFRNQSSVVLDEWFSEPDDKGEQFWLEHEQQLKEGMRI